MPRSLREVIADLPGISWLRRVRYVRQLKRGAGRGLFWGAYSSYSAAAAAAKAHPSGLAFGYDTPELAEVGRNDYDRMHLRDYPALFWLSTFLGDNDREPGAGKLTVVDLGGHLGGKFRAFRRYWPAQLTPLWVVLETSAAVDLAKQLPPGDRPEGLSFTTERAVLDGAWILFASGSLQYLERDVWDLLDELSQPPRHLVLTKVPLSDGKAFWTTQNADGKAIVPYHVWNRNEFLAELRKRGYRVLDEWVIPERSVTIPLQRGLGTQANSGLALIRNAKT
jgi:putative methyltransferase (TIGR04325 family)